MVRFAITFTTLFILISFYYIKAVDLEGALVLLPNKNSLFLTDDDNTTALEKSEDLQNKREAVFFFDAHLMKCFREQDEQESIDTYNILKEYSQTDGLKPLHILIEAGHDYDHKSTLGSLLKQLKEEPLHNVTIENIELRAASGALYDLIKHFPNHKYLSFDYRESNRQKIYYNDVTLQDVLDECENVVNPLKKAWEKRRETPELVALYYMKMTRAIERPYERIKKAIEELVTLYNISKSEKFEEVMKRVTQEEITRRIEVLGKNVFNLFSCIMDFYLMDRVLRFPEGVKILIFAGAKHSQHVKQEITGCLGGIDVLNYGHWHVKDPVPLTREQRAHLILGKKNSSMGT